MIGNTLGHYQITSQIGKGGMGEVFQAKDQVLGRDVAIKVLPKEFAMDADRVARFQREAKLLASLNHPNIAAIYGLEESAGTNFLVLELIEGDTLADRIQLGPIAVEESLKLALQIAEALEAAHEKGVIHRDLKPANIKVTPDGRVKVLDFGLAKAYAGVPSDVTLSYSPTISELATQKGVILGTAAYMSPEQAKGKTVDRRADVWAFGVVLFEMLTGWQLFKGETVSETLAAVLMREPDFSALPPDLHPRIRLLLERCLEKESRKRYGSINDAIVDIEKALSDPNGVLMQPVAAADPRPKLRTILPWAAATLVLGLIIAGLAVWNLKPSEPRHVMQFEYSLPEDPQFTNLTSTMLAISPDGSQYVYSTSKGLYLRSLGELTARLIAGTETNPMRPFFSPDGKWIAYSSIADNKLKKISVNGGAPVPLCNLATLGGSWSSDNTIVYGQLGGDIMRISADGGTPKSLVKAKSRILYSPQILPDGKSVLYSANVSGASRTIVQSLRSGDSKELFTGNSARYVPSGHIVYMSNNNLFAVPFDLNRLEPMGDAVPLVESLREYAVSDSGTLVYIPGAMAAVAANQRTLVWVDRKGKETPLAVAPDDFQNPKISPDGTRLAIGKRTGNETDIWIWDLARDNMTRLTFNESSYHPLWTHDGKRIVFQTGDKGDYSVVWKAADGSGTDEKLCSMPDAVLHPSSWSSDGKTLAVTAWGFGAPTFHIGVLPMEGDRKYRPLLKEQYLEAAPQISLDGRWMAYVSNESGKKEIYVRPFPEVDKGGRYKVSVAGGEDPLWSRDGRELFYRNGDSVIAVTVQTEPIFKPGKPEVLFQGKYVPTPSPNRPMWDVHPDGKRFLMMKDATSADEPATAPDSRKIVIVLNWFEELKQRVSVK